MHHRNPHCARLQPASLLLSAFALSLLAAALPAQKRPAPPPVVNTPAPKIQSAGLFVDRAGGKHPWRILGSHALVWDEAPYLPVGGAFTPRSLADATDSAWLDDVKALTTLKSKGVQDILLLPVKPLTEIPASALQRLFDYLDTNDFRYGLSFGPGIAAPLSGIIVKPISYRAPDSTDTLSATWRVPDADWGYYLLADAGQSSDNKIVREGVVPQREGIISIPVEPSTTESKVIALLYPHKTLKPSDDGSLPDLWNAFDDYRDRLLAYLGQVKFGKGLRFFLDPLARHIGFSGETDYLIPESEAFRVEWEAFLTRSYATIEEVKLNWSLSEGSFKSFRDLAKLMPLWANVNGVPYFRDMQSGATYRVLDARQSRWWQDFLLCRNESIAYYMNTVADLLKRQVAEVPVVYSWTQSHPIFSSVSRDGGYDGLGIPAQGGTPLGRVLCPAYSQAEQAERSLWCVATDITGSQPAPKPGPRTAALETRVAASKTSVGAYQDKTTLFHDLDALRRVGIKGFFADSAQSEASDSLDWLHEYAQRLTTEANAATYAPPVLFFPQNAPGPAHAGLVPGTQNVLWLASFASGNVQDWWPAYSGYTIQRGTEERDKETVLVSLQGRKETHLWVPDATRVQAFTPEGTLVPVKQVGKTQIVVTLSDTPTIFRAQGQELIPQEAADLALLQLTELVQIATAQKLPTTDNFRPSLERARLAYKQKDYASAYFYSRGALEELTSFAQPYIWLEGERTRQHTFGETAPNAEASGGAFLRLSTSNPPGRINYGARYVFDVPEDGVYQVWLAGSIAGPGTSPIRWKVNAEPEHAPATTATTGPLYLGDRFGWTLLGTARLQRGPNQSVTIWIADRAASPPDFIFSIDALMLTTRPFAPNGTIKPLPVDLAAKPGSKSKKKATPDIP